MLSNRLLNTFTPTRTWLRRRASSLPVSQKQNPKKPRFVNSLKDHGDRTRPTPLKIKNTVRIGGTKFSPLPAEPEDANLRERIRCIDDEMQYYSHGQGQFMKIPGIWLRDNCACVACRNPQTAQRQINVLKGGLDCKVVEAVETHDGQSYQITFGDGHKTILDKAFFNRHTSATQTRLHRAGYLPVHLWNAEIGRKPPTVKFDETVTNGLGDALRKIRTHGFCLVEGIEPTPEATQAFLESIGPITNTHYGGFYDFTSDLSSKDTAYTSEALEPHNDNSYFTAAAGLQALHLLSHTKGSGGESSLVDGFHAAIKLLEQNAGAYHCLSSTPIYAHASGNDGISVQPAQPRPVLSHSADTKSLMQVTWNNADRAGLSCTYSHAEKWYEAAAEFDALISDPKNQYWFQLKPGTLLIFDNWRVLHGRAAFTGKRRMCGGYIARDDFISKFKATNLSAKEIAASTVTG